MKHRSAKGSTSPLGRRGTLGVAAAGATLLAASAGVLAQEQLQQAPEQAQQQAEQAQEQVQQQAEQAQEQVQQQADQAREQVQQQGQQGQDRLQQSAEDQDVALLDQPAFVEETTEVNATVMEIEPGERTVSLRTDDGEELIVQAGEDVDLSRIEVGDEVEVTYYQALAAQLTTAPPGRGPAVIAARQAPVGERGGALGLVYTAIVTIDEVDTENNTVAFTTPEGEPREVVVERPEFQQLLTRLNEGDTVEVTYGEALAVSISPAE